MKTLLVTSVPVKPTTTQPELRCAPQDANGFVELGKELVDVLIANGVLG